MIINYLNVESECSKHTHGMKTVNQNLVVLNKTLV